MNWSSLPQRRGRGNPNGSFATITRTQVASQARGSRARKGARGAGQTARRARPAKRGMAKPAAQTLMLWRDSLWKMK